MVLVLLVLVVLVVLVALVVLVVLNLESGDVVIVTGFLFFLFSISQSRIFKKYSLTPFLHGAHRINQTHNNKIERKI